MPSSGRIQTRRGIVCSRRDPTNQKALWRRSNAYMKCGDYEKAHEDVRRLLRLEISEKMKKRVAKLSEKIMSKRKLQAKKQGKALRRFFSDDENQALYEDKTKTQVPYASAQSWKDIFFSLLQRTIHLPYSRCVWIHWYQRGSMFLRPKIIRSILSGRALMDWSLQMSFHVCHGIFIVFYKK